MKYKFSILCILGILTACVQKPENALEVNSLPNIYPDYIGVTIPAEIAPMNFDVVADSAEVERVFVVATGAKSGMLTSGGRYIDFDIDDWHELTAANVGDSILFQVFAKADGKWLKYQQFSMYVSTYALNDYGVTYRKIAPGFETFSKIGIYQRCLSTFDEEPIIEASAVDGQCLNCHYANRGNPDFLSVHVRGAHGCTLVRANGKDTYLNTKTPTTPGSCTYGYWHPDGKYCAYSLNRIFQNFYVGEDKIIEPWDAVSDVAVLNVETNELLCPSQLSTPDFQTTPAFSADGKKIYFCAAPLCRMPAEYDKLRYSLCSIDFNADSATFGAVVDTILDARALGKSVCLPRPSYDGRYIMYCLTDYGTTPINRQESDLYMLDLQTGEQRLMSEVNSVETDAYHNWSCDSHWFLFGSKREDHLYSLLYFSCVDGNGVATKPFLLPQRRPLHYYRESLYSYNAPDFTTRHVEINVRSLHSRVLSDQRIQVKALNVD
ncbi:MAG: hypothetical protein E7069_00540 [Bacteroidales bacterium]|nr:hypothetical protein [Bacteroidales bacterium]